MRVLHVVLLFSICLLVPGVAACGGGGGGGGSTPADESLLTGDYFLWGMAATAGAPPHGSSAWGPMGLDGMGALNGMGTTNDDGTIVGPLPVTAAYTVAADRETTLVLGGVAGYAGWTNAAGSVVLSGSVTNSHAPAVINLMKLGTGLSNATLAGDYVLCLYVVTTIGTTAALWGSATANGLGGGMAAVTGNFDGAILGPGAPQAIAYGVAPDGQVNWAFTGTGETASGCVLAGGDLAVFAGDPNPAGAPFLMVLIRKTTGTSAATLGGTYQIVGLEGAGSSYTSITGSVVSDGAGSITANFTRNTDGVISTSGPEIVGYTAGADGTLVVNPGGDPMHGGFSAGGAFFVIAGPDAAMTTPGFYVGLRR